jgi:dTMP kinase
VKRAYPGLFVAFEGGDGAGKSTQVGLLAAALRERGFDVVQTREPGGTEVGAAIRALLLDPASRIEAKTEALLFAADRAQHVAQVIRPALERGAVVVSDRFLASSIAYQGVARDLGPEKIEEISAWATGGLFPDITVLLKVSPEIGLARAKDRNRMEAESSEFHLAVTQGFDSYAAAHPERFLVLDATENERVLAPLIFEEVFSRLNL